MSETADELNQAISVSLRRVRPLFHQAATGGIDIAELLSTLELPVDLQQFSDDHVISLSDYYRIQNRLSILFGDETCHLSERQLLPGSTDFVLRNVGDCNNLYEAMQVIAESYNLLHGGQYNSVELSKNSVDYIIDDSTFPYTFDDDSDNAYFAMECILIFLHCMLKTVCAENAEGAVRRLSLTRPKRDARCRHLSYWNVPVRFGAARYRVSFDVDAATKSMPRPAATSLSSKAVHQKIIEAVGDRHGVGASSTYDQVYDALLNGIVEQQAIAEKMGVSVATLRRRLSEEGFRFRNLRQDVLNDAAKRLLQDHHSVSFVSETLGFAEFRSFVRAFKSWNGMTPTDYVSRLRES